MNVVVDNLSRFLSGALVTVELTVVAFLGAFVIGLVVAAFRVSPVLPLRAAGTLFVDVVRNIPLAVHFVLFFFAFPKVGITFPPLTSAFVVLAVYHGSFAAETIRAGINTVPQGQTEAARALGFTFPSVLGRVVLPQALRAVVPPLGNLFIALTKNSSLAYTISVVELTGVADKVANDTARPIPAFLGTAAGYLILTLPSAFIVRRLERRLAVRR
ncbi:MAG: amino acid ABC transporter permease [Actinomycetota bacterium]|nr:amino acid ABC transporter permease [Actinomycetota bacterium]